MTNELEAEADRTVVERQEAERLEAWGYMLNSSKLFAGHRFSDHEEVKQALAGMTSYDREEVIVRAVASLGDYIDWLEKRLDARIDEEAEKRRRDLDSPDSRVDVHGPVASVAGPLRAWTQNRPTRAPSS